MHPAQSSPLGLLMEEHQMILQAISSLEAYVELYSQGDSSAEHEDFSTYVRFIRSFSDAHHHGKEEEILFKKMIESGFPSEQGPIAVMLSEHDEGRALTRELARIASKDSAQVTEADRARAKDSALTYAQLLRQHIQKEDRILYPMAANFLTGASQTAMADEFLRFETDFTRKREIAALRTAINELISRYPGKAPATSTFEGHCFGCGSR